MANKFPKGTLVEQIVKPIRGVVDGDFRVDQETGQVQIPVSWIDEDGVLHSRYFDQSEIEAVAAEE